VRVHSSEQEAEAQEILMRHGGEAVHVHEIELAKRPEDLPLHSLRADPWLSDERLGQP
jgi:uroporphyrinogen-III synthase